MTKTGSQNTCTGAEVKSTREGKVSLVRVIILLVPALAVFLIVLNRHIPHGHRPPPQYECNLNLRDIVRAKATWAAEHEKLPSDVPQESDLFGKGRYIPQRPVCPKGGTYTLGAVDEKPTCSIPGHTLSNASGQNDFHSTNSTFVD